MPIVLVQKHKEDNETVGATYHAPTVRVEGSY